VTDICGGEVDETDCIYHQHKVVKNSENCMRKADNSGCETMPDCRVIGYAFDGYEILSPCGGSADAHRIQSCWTVPAADKHLAASWSYPGSPPAAYDGVEAATKNCAGKYGWVDFGDGNDANGANDYTRTAPSGGTKTYWKLGGTEAANEGERITGKKYVLTHEYPYVWTKWLGTPSTTGVEDVSDADWKTAAVPLNTGDSTTATGADATCEREEQNKLPAAGTQTARTNYYQEFKNGDEPQDKQCSTDNDTKADNSEFVVLAAKFSSRGFQVVVSAVLAFAMLLIQ
jgi:hypothetical protein